MKNKIDFKIFNENQLKKQKNMKKYYHISSTDSVEIEFLTEYEAEKYCIVNGNMSEPFNTLGECKKDAMDYHRCTKYYANECIKKIAITRTKDFK